MRNLIPNTSSDALLIADAVQAMALPPPSFGLVPAIWNGVNGDGAVPQVDLEVWAAGAVNLTDAELYAGMLHPFAFADVTSALTAAVRAFLALVGPGTLLDTVIEAVELGTSGNAITIATVADGSGGGTLDESAYPALVFHYEDGVTTVEDFEAAVALATKIRVKTPGTAANVLAAPGDTFGATPLAGGVDAKLHAVAHGLLTGDGDVNHTAAVTMPTGLAALTKYWVIKLGADDFAYADSLEHAMQGVRVQFTTVGAGAQKTVDTATTERVHWQSLGLLGPAGDGAISLTAQQGYATRRDHRSRVMAYAMVATFGGAVDVSAAMFPIQEKA